MRNEIRSWAEDLKRMDKESTQTEKKSGGIKFSDEMREKFEGLDEVAEKLTDADFPRIIEEYQKSGSTEALVAAMALGYKYIIGCMMKNENWKPLPPDRAMIIAFQCLPRSLRKFELGRGKFLSFWARGAEMSWDDEKKKYEDWKRRTSGEIYIPEGGEDVRANYRG